MSVVTDNAVRLKKGGNIQICFQFNSKLGSILEGSRISEMEKLSRHSKGQFFSTFFFLFTFQAFKVCIFQKSW